MNLRSDNPLVGLERFIHFILNLLFERRDIVINGQLYLRRWYLKGRGTSAQWFLHNIRLPDEGRDFHDHPWPFKTTILSGGYTEQVLFENKAYGAGNRTWVIGQQNTNLFATFRHRITSVLPRTYTLVKAGKAVRDWGFWVKKPRVLAAIGAELYDWVHHREHLGIPDTVETPLEDRWQ